MKWLRIAQKKLKKILGYDELKPKQIKIIDKLINGKDVLGLLPTGYGKSLCYLIPPIISKKCMIIVSPLISLMEDQKMKLEEEYTCFSFMEIIQIKVRKFLRF